MGLFDSTPSYDPYSAFAPPDPTNYGRVAFEVSNNGDRSSSISVKPDAQYDADLQAFKATQAAKKALQAAAPQMAMPLAMPLARSGGVSMDPSTYPQPTQLPPQAAAPMATLPTQAGGGQDQAAMVQQLMSRLGPQALQQGLLGGQALPQAQAGAAPAGIAPNPFGIAVPGQFSPAMGSRAANQVNPGVAMLLQQLQRMGIMGGQR